MKSFKDFLPKSKWTYFFFAAIVIMFLALAVYVYSKNLKGKLNPSYVENREFIEKDEGSNEAQVVFFTVDWCPYCKKALPIWKEFCEKYDNKNINGHTVSCETFNCTDEKDNLVKRTMDKYKIEGFPTIKMIINDEVYDYEAKPTMEHLEEWINVTLK
jgi:thiol-disulfide isomerase/thioredoxin